LPKLTIFPLVPIFNVPVPVHIKLFPPRLVAAVIEHLSDAAITQLPDE